MLNHITMRCEHATSEMQRLAWQIRGDAAAKSDNTVLLEETIRLVLY